MKDPFDVVHRRAAGLDVHKMSITVSVREASDGGAEASIETRDFSALEPGLREMADWLKERGVTGAVMEATGIYWERPFDVLVEAGIGTRLLNARHVKQLRGHKTDVADSIWLARICQFGLERASYVPPRACRILRMLCQHRRKMVEDRSRLRNRAHKIIDRCGIRLGGVISDIFGMTGRQVLAALLAGKPAKDIIASLSPRMAKKAKPIADAISADLDPASVLMLRDLLKAHDQIQARIVEIEAEIDRHASADEDRIALLTTMPGIDRAAAIAVLAEIGPDLSVFPSGRHLAAWAGLAPGNSESAGKRRKTRARSGNRRLRTVLVECAQAAARTNDCQFKGCRKALTVRRQYKRAVVATAHKMLRAIYAMLRDGTPYQDPETDYEAMLVRRNAPRWIRSLIEQGYIVRNRDGTVKIRHVLPPGRIAA